MDVSNYQFGALPLDMIDYVKKKSASARAYFRYFLNRTLMMFKYKNLPETVDEKMLERYLQLNGLACFTQAEDGNYYVFNGSVGGPQDVYYRPTIFIVSNPHLSQLNAETPLPGGKRNPASKNEPSTTASGNTFTKECVVFGDQPHTGVLLRNDTEWFGLTPLISRYAVLMCENTLTIRTATIMLRIIALLTAGSDKAKKSAEAYLKKLEAGELGIIGDSLFQESINLQSPPSNNGSYLTQFIELQQYLKGSFFNELGLRANYNMKREAIGTGESTMDADAILPLCDNMLQCRREDVEKINELYGLNISVDFSSAWLESRLSNSLMLISQLNESGALALSGSDLGPQGSNSSIPEEVEVDKNGGNQNVERQGEDRGAGEAGEEDVEVAGRAGNYSERSGSETAEAGEPGERSIDRSGESGESNSGETSGENGSGETSGENSSGENSSGENSSGESSSGETPEDQEEAGVGESGVDESAVDESAVDESAVDESAVDESAVDDVVDELKSDELTLTEGVVEVLNSKVSQLIAEAREGDI
jgi:hypothetical protein